MLLPATNFPHQIFLRSSQTTLTMGITSSTARAPQVSGATYLGCYTDLVGALDSHRVLPDYNTISFSMTVEKCSQIMADYNYFGVEYSNECWGAVSLAPGTIKVSDADCNFECPGDKNETCGAANRINIYSHQAAGSVSTVYVTLPASTITATATPSTVTATPAGCTATPTPLTTLPQWNTYDYSGAGMYICMSDYSSCLRDTHFTTDGQWNQYQISNGQVNFYGYDGFFVLERPDAGGLVYSSEDDAFAANYTRIQCYASGDDHQLSFFNPAGIQFQSYVENNNFGLALPGMIPRDATAIQVVIT